ncbi:MAG: pilus assembly protein [Deltaproteobacteria bacterium]|nr:pilus assembly protein [Deltaproteobacteria bacterium]
MVKINQVKNNRGAALVEFALVLPLLLLLLVGLIEFGLLFYNKQVLTNASREGARAGIARVGNISDIVDNYCRDRLISFSSPNAVDTDVDGEGGAFNADLMVTVKYDYDFLLPSLLGFGTKMQLSTVTVMKMMMIEDPT